MVQTPVRRLAGVIFPRGARNGLIVMLAETDLAGYFDESGTGLHEKIMVVGGFVGRVSQWDKLHFDWFHILSNAGLDPSTQFFHRSVFEARHKPWMKGKKNNIYESWSDRKAQSVLDALVGSICKRMKWGLFVTASVVVDEYEAVKGAPEFPANRYHFVSRCVRPWRIAGRPSTVLMNQSRMCWRMARATRMRFSSTR